MGSRINRLLGRDKDLERPQPHSHLNSWIKRLVLGFGTTTISLGLLMILSSLMPDDHLLNLSLTARSILDEAESTLLSVNLSDYELEDPVFCLIGLILFLITMYTYLSAVWKKRRSETGITTDAT
jgi:hypothetical protein